MVSFINLLNPSANKFQPFGEVGVSGVVRATSKTRIKRAEQGLRSSVSDFQSLHCCADPPNIGTLNPLPRRDVRDSGDPIIHSVLQRLHRLHLLHSIPPTTTTVPISPTTTTTTTTTTTSTSIPLFPPIPTDPPIDDPDGPRRPLPFSLADRDIQAIVDAYKDDPGNPKYAFKHLLFSVTDPAARVKPAGISDIMWAEAMGKLEGMQSADRERLWPQLVQGFKDLSQRLKLQDEVILSDAERLRMTQANVKMLQRHFQADTLPWIQRMRQKEQGLQRRLLRVMRIIEALEGKGCRMPLVKDEAELAEKLAALTMQLKGSGAELSRRVHNLLSVSRVRANGIGGGGAAYLPRSTKINEESLVDLQEVLQQQTEAIARMGTVLKRDIRDMEIIMAEDADIVENGNKRIPFS
ncbi:hypothetical protein Sjap_016468 [Stephania japonica]|uniref:Nucleoporin Nup54 alpha-helical domain-containing protein n=1 Tax=Stephania japonica TaxID=461633 RepID=A0AAP0NV06_9MAGN